MANSTTDDSSWRRQVRRATPADAAAVQRLLRMGVYVHVHIDWRPPGEWLGTPGFVVYDKESAGTEKKRRAKQNPDGIIAAIAVGASPPPAAWVRLAAVDSTVDLAQANAMFAKILQDLDPAIDEIAWFLNDYWPLHWLEDMGFVPVTDVLAYYKDDLTVPRHNTPPALEIRPVLMEDFAALAAIETAAFEPRWRHSAEDLHLAWRHSISFEVALLDGEPAGFQISTGGDGNAHLSRMTVHPARQGLGIGAALLVNAMRSYRLQNISTITLNTQSDNLASRRLYERFGFRPTGHSYPVWTYYPARKVEIIDRVVPLCLSRGSQTALYNAEARRLKFTRGTKSWRTRN